MNKCLFLDRDGVINRDVGYAFKPEQFEFMPHIFDQCLAAEKAGYMIIIVTNQSGIARGYYSEQDFSNLNQWLTGQFKQKGITVTAIFHCPHHPDFSGDCDCRKPKPGMMLSAIQQYNIDPESSLMVGDKPSDMAAAAQAGVKTRILFTDSEDLAPADATDVVKSLKNLNSYF